MRLLECLSPCFIGPEPWLDSSLGGIGSRDHLWRDGCHQHGPWAEDGHEIGGLRHGADRYLAQGPNIFAAIPNRPSFVTALIGVGD